MSIENQIKILSTGYNDMPHLRAAIALIPGIGSTLDFYLSMPGQKFAEERIEYMIRKLQEQMQNINENSINKEMFNTEAGFDIVNKAFIISARTRQRQKLNLLASIVKGAFTIQSKPHDSELYLRIVDELTVKELEIVLLLYKIKITKEIQKSNENTEDGMMIRDSWWIAKNYPNYSRDELDFIFPRLERTGLIKELVGTYVGYGGGSYNPTSLLSDFIEFLDNKSSLSD